jgi:hypothetical protein
MENQPRGGKVFIVADFGADRAAIFDLGPRVWAQGRVGWQRNEAFFNDA